METYTNFAIAPTSSFTASTLFWNAACSSSVSSSSMIRSTPLAPRIDRHADVVAADAVLLVAVRGAGNQPLLVADDRLDHLRRRRRRGVVGAAGLQQADDLGAAVARAVDDFVAAARGSMSCVTGMPPTVVQLGIGTIVSPWPPISSAEMSSTLTPSSIARNVR